MLLFNWLHNYSPQPILVKIGWLEIHWYGFLIALGAILAFMVVWQLGQKYGLKKDKIYDLAFYLIIFGLIGDRLYYVFYAWEYYSHNLLDIFKIWQGGLAIHGAMIAGILVIFFYSRKNKINPWLLADIFIIALPLAMAFGRWGNYFNQELFGRPTDLAWGIPILPEKRPLEFVNNAYFHPTFLYESIWNFITFAFLWVWHKQRLARLGLLCKASRSQAKYENNLEKIQGLGNITLVYFILYSIGRFLNEFLRIDYSPYFLGLRWAQFVSLIIIGVCLIILLVKKIKKRIKRAA
ncbi:MAG: prolipoprotein diacylglyceryl transferase [Candidatus Parcubacteria bacterium]|nr:prolipoprotein diacylglyceryl transferase [Candidatus Parcubacteria bacterium]